MTDEQFREIRSEIQSLHQEIAELKECLDNAVIELKNEIMWSGSDD